MTTTRTLRTGGMGVFLAGLVTFLVSTLIAGGFFHGLFQGMTIALMVGAAYLFGAQWRHGRHEHASERDPEAMWLPSRDEDRE